MRFDKDKYNTLDGSCFIEVYSKGGEFIFQFAVNKTEIKALQKVLVDALTQIETE